MVMGGACRHTHATGSVYRLCYMMWGVGCRHTHATGHTYRLKDNLSCWSLTLHFILRQAVFLVHPYVYQANSSVSIQGASSASPFTVGVLRLQMRVLHPDLHGSWGIKLSKHFIY